MLGASSCVEKAQAVSLTTTGSAKRFEFILPRVGKKLETSIIYLTRRSPNWIICVPSQIGCNLRCQFCGLRSLHSNSNNLSVEDITWLLERTLMMSKYEFVPSLANSDQYQVSFMGQGEPFLNIQNVMSVVRRQLESQSNGDVVAGISTVGFPKLVMKLISSVEPSVLRRIKFQLSLHSAIEETRLRLMPNANHASLQAIGDVFAKLATVAQRKVCINYLLLDGVNDDAMHLAALQNFVDPTRFYVKLSSLNDTAESLFRRSPPERVESFMNALISEGIEARYFRSEGEEIGAGCGQLGSGSITLRESRE